MDKSVQGICNTLKKIIWQLKPQNNALSFLLLTGKMNQGKKVLLRQSGLQHMDLLGEEGAEFYYNQHGIVLMLDESWFNESKTLLQHTLKQLNRCHYSCKISGILLCVDINELITAEPSQVIEQTKPHAQLLHRIGQSLGYVVDMAILFTKMDALAGFCEFFQYEHAAELAKPLGFSLGNREPNKRIEHYKSQFEQFVEMLGQKIIHKMHPARSGIKRTLIREFPLQIASLRIAIQALLQQISPRWFHVQAIYFTSAEQGGISIDRVNKKIKHEYALAVQDTFPQSVNHKAYFVQGAIRSLQNQCKQLLPRLTTSHKAGIWALASFTGLFLIILVQHHLNATYLLDEASKELLEYESETGRQNDEATPALFHLVRASASLEKISSNGISLPTIEILKSKLHIDARQHLNHNFLPGLIHELEQTMVNPQQTPATRFQALKIYLMLGNPEHYSQHEVFSWFEKHWQKEISSDLTKKMTLMKQVLQEPFQPIAINQQTVNDIRNYLNALPVNYFYYSLAKEMFPAQKNALTVPGFQLSPTEVPVYFTRTGFKETLQALPKISQQLQQSNWILGRENLENLTTALHQAYCYDYIIWWQNFLKHSHPLHFKNYREAQNLTQVLNQTLAIQKLIELVQAQTAPDLSNPQDSFNQDIASKFATINLLTSSTLQDLAMRISELEKFLTTISIINDEGNTAFNLTKARFLGDTLTNPVSMIHAHAERFPEPVSNWLKQIAEDAWFLLINDTKNYINKQWQLTAFRDYQNQIAHRYPFDSSQTEEVALADFEHFFSAHGVFNNFFEFYVKPFLDTSTPEWRPKEVDHYIMPISQDTINELIRANILTSMFFPNQNERSKIEFTLQKINLDPIVGSFTLHIGQNSLHDDQNSDSLISFTWPEPNAKLILHSIEGEAYALEESGMWAFFKMLQKVNVLADEQDSSSLQILFEINGNSGRYLLKTHNQINPFIPGILNGFVLNETIV